MGELEQRVVAPVEQLEDCRAEISLRPKSFHDLIGQVEILDNLKHAITLEAPQLIGSKIRKFLNYLKNYSTLD